VKRDDGDHTSERIYLREIGYFERIAPEEEVRLAKRPSSLDAPLSAEPITELGELVPDEAATIPDCELVDKNMSALLRSLTGKLTDREVKILTHRFGLDGAETETLEEIVHQFGDT